MRGRVYPFYLAGVGLLTSEREVCDLAVEDGGEKRGCELDECNVVRRSVFRVVLQKQFSNPRPGSSL